MVAEPEKQARRLVALRASPRLGRSHTQSAEAHLSHLHEGGCGIGARKAARCKASPLELSCPTRKFCRDVDLLSAETRSIGITYMSIKKSKPGVVAALPIAAATAPEPVEHDTLEAPVRPLLDEMRAFYEAILPPDMAADWHEATELYITTHPVHRERLHAMLAKRMKQSAELGAPSAPKDAAVLPERKAGRR